MRHRIVDCREKELRACTVAAVADIKTPSSRRSFAIGHEFPRDKLGMTLRSRVVGEVGPVAIKDRTVSGFQIEEISRHRTLCLIADYCALLPFAALAAYRTLRTVLSMGGSITKRNDRQSGEKASDKCPWRGNRQQRQRLRPHQAPAGCRQEQRRLHTVRGKRQPKGPRPVPQRRPAARDCSGGAAHSPSSISAELQEKPRRRVRSAHQGPRWAWRFRARKPAGRAATRPCSPAYCAGSPRYRCGCLSA